MATGDPYRQEVRENHFGHIGAEKFLLEDKNTPNTACLPVGLYSIVFCNCM